MPRNWTRPADLARAIERGIVAPHPAEDEVGHLRAELLAARLALSHADCTGRCPHRRADALRVLNAVRGLHQRAARLADEGEGRRRTWP